MENLIEVGTLGEFKKPDDRGLIEVKDPNFLKDLSINRAQRSLETVKSMDPDVEARRINLSKKTGLPWSLLRSREQAIKEQSELPDLNNYKTYGQKTFQYYQDLQNAAISKDDLDNLYNLERTTQSLKPDLTLGRVLGRFWNDFKKSISDRAAGNVTASERFDPASREDVLRYFHMLNSVEKAESYKISSQYLEQGLSQEEAEAKAMVDRLGYHKKYWAKLRDLPALEESEEFKGKSSGFIEDVSGGIGSSILGISSTAANPVVGMADIFQQMYGAKAEQLKEAGVDPRLAQEAAKISATGQTPLEFAGNLIGLKFLKKAFKPGSAKEFMVTLLESAAAEGLEEYAQTFPEEYANIVAANPDATDAELIQKFIDDLPEIATSKEAQYSAAIGATIGALFPTAGRVTGGTLNLIDRQIKTAQFNQKLDSLSEAVEATNTKERAPERIKQFIDQIGASETAYITPDGVELLFQSSPEDAQEIINQIADTPEFAQQAVIEGHDVKIDTGKFLSFLTPEQQDLIKPDLKPAPSAPSLREIENTDLSEELAKDEDYYAEVIEAEKTFRDEMNRLHKQVVESGYSKQYADDFSQIVERFADRMGLEGLDKKGFVQKIVVQSRKEPVDSDGLQYNQEGRLITDSKAFRKWFVDSKIVDEEGKPMVVYHGSGVKDIESFDPAKAGEIQTSDWGPGIHFTPSKFSAEYYRQYAAKEIDEKATQLWGELEAKTKELGTTPMDAAIDLGFGSEQYNELGVFEDRWKERIREVEQGNDGEIYPVYLSLQNPLYYAPQDITDPYLAEEAKAKGHDGIIVTYKDDTGVDEIVVFEPNQIKSVNNQGSFNISNPNIFHQGKKQSKVKEFFQKVAKSIRLNQGEKDESKRASIQITDEKYLVNLFEEKNLSSLVHETGHIFLNEFQLLASTENATDQLKLDYESVRKWLKLSSGQKIEKSHHEQFAKGFEAYLMEGKAPTTDLIPVFQRFKNWLMSVYQSVKDIGIELNDEVRSVFDRMFTARQEVFRSAQQNNMSMLSKAEMDTLGVVADDRLYLERLHKKMLTDAEEALHRDRTRNRRSLIKTWQSMAGKRFDDDPVNRFVKFLSDGAGISKVDLQETFGSEMAEILTRKRVPPIIKIDGMGVNEATVQGGFQDPYDMVKALMNIQKKEDFIKAYTERESEAHDARYQVEEFIADTEAYSDFLEIKNKYLNRSQGVPTEITPWRAFKAHAQKSLNAKPVRDAIAHHIYMGAYSKYNNTEKSKIRQGKLGEAATANEYARLNYEMSKQAVRNRKFMERTENRVKRLLNSKAIHPDAQYQIIDLAARFGLVHRKTGENLEQTLERLRENVPKEDRKPLNDWVKEKIQNAYEIELPDFVLDSTVKNYKDLSFTNFEKLAETFQILKTIDQQERYYNALGEAIKIETVVEELEQKMFSTMTPKVLKTLNRNAINSTLSGLNAVHTKMEFLLRKLDGGDVTSTWWKYLFKPISDAESARDDRLKEVRKKLKSKELFGRFSGNDLEGLFHKPIFTERMPLKMTKNQVLSVALNVGTLDNKAKLLDGYGWTEGQLDAILDNLTKEDWQFVQNVLDYVGTFKEDSFAVAKEMTGKRPEEVEAEPVITKFGELPGGYYPLVYDSKLSFSSFLHEQATDIKGLFRKAHSSANTRPGSHFARQASAGGQKVKLDVSVISDHIFEVVHDITHRKAVINISKLLRNRRLQRSLTSTIGVDTQSQLIDWLHDVSVEKSNPSDSFHKLLRWARTGTTVMNMGLKATTMITQFVGYTQTIDELGIKQAAKGLNMFYGSGSDYTKIGDRIDFVMEKSGFMRNRLNAHDRDIRDALKNISPGKKINTKVQRFSFLGIGLFQMGVDLPTWYGAYDLAYKKFVDLDADKIDQKAVDYADSVVRMTQGAGGTKDLSKIQRGDEAMRLFTMFYGYFNTLYNLAALRTSSVKKISDVGALAASALWLWFLPALLAEAVAGRGPEEDEEWGEWAMPILAMHPFQTVVGVRDATNYAFGKYGYQITPAQAAPKEIADFLRVGKYLEEDEPGKAVKQTAESLGYIMKWPMKQVIITTGNIYDYTTGKDPDFYIRDLYFRKPKSRR